MKINKYQSIENYLVSNHDNIKTSQPIVHSQQPNHERPALKMDPVMVPKRQVRLGTWIYFRKKQQYK